VVCLASVDLLCVECVVACVAVAVSVAAAVAAPATIFCCQLIVISFSLLVLLLLLPMPRHLQSVHCVRLRSAAASVGAPAADAIGITSSV
jgi:hypothetical protein